MDNNNSLQTMITKNFLSLEQVKELALLGVTFDDSEMVYRVYRDTLETELHERTTWKKELSSTIYEAESDSNFYPAPTLSEVLDRLPKILIVDEDFKMEVILHINWVIVNRDKEYWEVEYYSKHLDEFSSKKKLLIDAAFETLKWVAINYPEQLNNR